MSALHVCAALHIREWCHGDVMAMPRWHRVDVDGVCVCVSDTIARSDVGDFCKRMQMAL